jgi:hypothetical protein
MTQIIRIKTYDTQHKGNSEASVVMLIVIVLSVVGPVFKKKLLRAVIVAVS